MQKKESAERKMSKIKTKKVLTPEQKNAISHRGKALRLMREELEKAE